MNITLSITNGETIRAEQSGTGEIWLVSQGAYQPGDVIHFTTDQEGFYLLRLEEALGPVLVYAKAGTFTLPVPFDEKKICYNPIAFTGNIHFLSARTARPWEADGMRDLSYNPLDCHENRTLFPHASANVETRGESVFAARNAIDGVVANHSHGAWPYASWGINRDPDAALTLDFGRTVEIHQIVLYLRADFPHDAWWKEAKVTFDETTTLTLPLVKSDRAQEFPLQPTVAKKLVLHDLVKADDPSPFPALTQIRVIGRETH
jgi:hypothetical protein